MIEIFKIVSCSFLPNIPYTVSKSPQNRGRVKESYKGIGGDANLRLYITNMQTDIPIHLNPKNNYGIVGVPIKSNSLLTPPSSLFIKWWHRPKTRKRYTFWCKRYQMEEICLFTNIYQKNY